MLLRVSANLLFPGYYPMLIIGLTTNGL